MNGFSFLLYTKKAAVKITAAFEIYVRVLELAQDIDGFDGGEGGFPALVASFDSSAI